MKSFVIGLLHSDSKGGRIQLVRSAWISCFQFHEFNSLRFKLVEARTLILDVGREAKFQEK